jgi:hypothetical protein
MFYAKDVVRKMLDEVRMDTSTNSFVMRFRRQAGLIEHCLMYDFNSGLIEKSRLPSF